MKIITLVNIVFFSFIIPISAQDSGKAEITNLLWKINDGLIQEACVEDCVRITFHTVNISPNDNLVIRIYEKNDTGNDDFVTEIICPADGNNSINWIIEFDETKNNTSTNELTENGFTIPEYYFTIKYGEYISEKSNIIKIYGYIDITLTDENTGEVFPNKPYTIYFSNGTKHEGASDENGRIKIRNAIIGDRYIRVGDEE
ncbi:MAG: hypothetical protein LBK13_13910 [Spirochaetales bacterium]|jgi:hypothetical protein|nr:hypothetical protein [Spirochaetales bacterium]